MGGRGVYCKKGRGRCDTLPLVNALVGGRISLPNKYVVTNRVYIQIVFILLLFIYY